jgi:hypothetical protein
MMKKLVSMAAAMALALCLSVSVFAAGSKTILTDVQSVTDKNGNAVTVTTAAITTADAMEQTTAESLAAKNAGTSNQDTITILDQKEISAPAGTSFPITLTWDVSSVSSNMELYVVHNSDWIKATRSGDTISVSVNSTSPFYLIGVERLTKTAGTTTTGTASTSTTASPKTGEGNFVGFAAAAAVLGCGGACLVTRKKHI